MKIRVLFFARARELCELSEMDFEVSDDGANLVDLKKEILIRFPMLNDIWQSVIFAKNQEYVTKEDEGEVDIRDGDEIAIIPPISGG